MDDRFAAVTAVLVGVAVAAVGTAEYVLPGFAPPPYDPFATGVFVVGSGLLLILSGGLAFANELDHLGLRASTAVGLFALLLAVFNPESLLFGGVFWLGMVVAGGMVLGTYRTINAVQQNEAAK